MATQRIYGYADPWSIKAGETLCFMVSGEGLEAVDAQLVILIHGDENPGGPGFIEEEWRAPFQRNFRYASTVLRSALMQWSMTPSNVWQCPAISRSAASVYPTKPGIARQAILSKWDIMSSKGLCARHRPRRTSRILGRRRRNHRPRRSRNPAGNQGLVFRRGELQRRDPGGEALPDRGDQSLQFADRAGGAVRPRVTGRRDLACDARGLRGGDPISLGRRQRGKRPPWPICRHALLRQDRSRRRRRRGARARCDRGAGAFPVRSRPAR